jgi:hypothetical protein
MSGGHSYYETQQIGDGAETRVHWIPGFWRSLRKGLEALRLNATRWQEEIPTLTPATLRLYRVAAEAPAALELVLAYRITPAQITASLAPQVAEELHALLSEEPGLLAGGPR